MVNKKGNNTGLIVAGVGVGMAVLFGLIAGSAKAGSVESLGGEAPNDMDMTIDEQIELALSKIKNFYGVEFARKIEQLLRWETAHFKSGGWLATNAAGMEATDNLFPYGWQSLAEFVSVAGEDFNLTPESFSLVSMQENNSNDAAAEKFIVWPNAFSFIIFLAWFISNKRQGRPGYWYSMNENSAASYENSISGVNTPIVDSLP